MKLTSLQRRRLSNFRANRRAFWSLWIFSTLFLLSLFAELIANDRPLLVSYKGELRAPIMSFYSEADYGGDYRTEASYADPELQCLIISGGLADTCFVGVAGAQQVIVDIKDGSFQVADKGWMLWPLIPYKFNTVDTHNVKTAPGAPDRYHWLGTDDQARDVLSRIIYGFRISIIFAIIVTVTTSVLGIIAGAAQGYYGGLFDLMFQRFTEIWGSLPSLYIIIILSAIFNMTFWLLVLIIVAFGWGALDGVVRAEFLRARNFEYVRAARALGVRDRVIIFRHVLPNAMVATLTMLPFIVTGTIGALAGLDFLGFGLPSSYPSLGELTLQAKSNLNSPWLGFSAFFTFTIMLSLLVFIFEGVRDAFDPRKTFQ